MLLRSQSGRLPIEQRSERKSLSGGGTTEALPSVKRLRDQAVPIELSFKGSESDTKIDLSFSCRSETPSFRVRFARNGGESR